MNEYSKYTIKVSLKSPIVTPFQSDTIFGHICWAIRFLQWEVEDKLREFLMAYDEEKNPPLLVSNGFPQGYLPKPVLPPITQEELDEVIGRERRITDSFKVKTLKRMEILPKADFLHLQKNRIMPLDLLKIMHRKYDTISGDSSKYQTMIVQHNTINRIEGRVTQGLYAQEETFYVEGYGKFEIYLKTWFFTLEDLQRVFDYIKEAGFGKDKSTGKGHFDFQIKEGMDLDDSKDSNGFLTISSYIPRHDDPIEGHYRILPKFGKLGGLYAKGLLKKNPFKKPLIMFSAGSTFYDSEYRQDKIYGSLLKGVHHDERIRHYAYAFPIGIKL